MSSSAISRSACHEPRITTARRGPLRVSYRATQGEPRVLYVVPKSVGPAVVRNRARRRVREVLRELARDGAVVLGAGEFRLGIFAPLEDLPAPELRATVGELMTEAQR